MSNGASRPDVAVFDLGGVLLDWSPRYLYDRLIPDEAARGDFLSRICPQPWNEEMDAGKPIAAGVAERQALFPDHAPLIADYYGRWEEMLAGEIPGTAALVRRLKEAGVPLYAITNFSAETLPRARRTCPTLALFQGMIVSGEEGLIKPDPAIFRLFLSRYGLEAGRCLFIDDREDNCAAAAALGFHAHHFTAPEALEQALRSHGLLG